MKSARHAIAKLVRAGDPGRTSRFHTQRCDRAPLSSLADLPVCLLHSALFKIFGRRPTLPWIPYPAIRFLRTHLTHASRVLEIGSGMSTLWLAQHCDHVDSIEADQRWVGWLREEIARRHLSNVEVLFRWQAAEMCDFSNWPDASLDLVFVDGGPRPQCCEAALPKLKPGGFLYVDNTDIAKTAANSRELIEAYGRERYCAVRIFRGFVPCNLFVNEGMLLQNPYYSR
jgi:predicted O-methyltransferase YrrM